MLYWFTKAFLCAFMIYAWVFAVRFDDTGNAKTSTSGTGGIRVPRFFCVMSGKQELKILTIIT